MPKSPHFSQYCGVSTVTKNPILASLIWDHFVKFPEKKANTRC